MLVAEKMNLRYPSLLVTCKDGKKIFSYFCKSKPQSNDQSRKELAKLFLLKTSTAEIFPKLSPAIKLHEGKWKRNSLAKLVSTQMNAESNKLFLEISDIADYLPANSATN